MRASLAIPFFCLAASITPSFAVSMKPDRIPSVVARVNGEAAGELVQAAAHPFKDAAISNLVAAAAATGIGVLSHAFVPVKEHSRREVLELLEERINEEFFTREYKRDLLVTLLDSLA